jgi:hypothetical protein
MLKSQREFLAGFVLLGLPPFLIVLLANREASSSY